MRACYRLADDAVARGDHPFGALLALDGRIVGTALNAVETADDPTRHAETELLSVVLPTLARDERSRVVLYTSSEPCVMCAGAIYWAGISTLVFGCGAAALAEEAGADFLVPCREVLARGARAVTVIGPVLEAEGRAQHQAYWPARRL
jgi:tRNA(Arg) A34 adenosine deaminase TadA